MGDRFQRQVSHRWVKAETPSYGDDWGDNQSDLEDIESVPAKSLKSLLPSDRSVKSAVPTSNVKNLTLATDKSPSPPLESSLTTKPPRKTAPNLVLSIDTLVREESDESSDGEVLDENEIGAITEEGRDPLPQVILRNVEKPPHAPFSPAINTPASDRSFLSDAESIQIEPDSLRLFDHSNKPFPDPKHEQQKLSSPIEPHQVESTKESLAHNTSVDDIHYDLDSLASDGQKEGSIKSASSPSRPSLPPLVISIDKKKSQYDSDDSDVSSILDDAALHLHDSINKEREELTQEDQDSDDDWGSDSEDDVIARDPKVAYELEHDNGTSNASHEDDKLADALPKPLFPDLSQRLYDDTGLIVDHNAHDADEAHTFQPDQKVGISLSIANSSLECLPLNLTESRADSKLMNKDTHDANSDVGHTRSVRKPPSTRADLVSVDYSSIADAMDGYLDGHSLAKESHGDGQSNVLTKLVSNASEGLNTNTMDPLAGFAKPMIPGLVDRRASTQSTKTFTLGNWTPNTGQFRDQFIREDDMESNFSFAPEDEKVSSLRSEFVKKVGSRGIGSSRSSLSLNETTDGDYPNSKAATADSKDVGMQFGSTSTETESVFQNHPHPTPLFIEERSTPDHSTEALTGDLSQKYSSLIPPLTLNNVGNDSKDILTNEERPMVPITEENDQEGKSSSGQGSVPDKNETQSSSKYPLYDWKKIQTASQPVDRIKMLKDALKIEQDHDTGLRSWLDATLKPSEEGSSMHIGKIALEAYQNAAHRDIRRHVLIRSTVHNVKDKVETGGLQATSLGKRLINRGRKLMSGGSTE